MTKRIVLSLMACCIAALLNGTPTQAAPEFAFQITGATWTLDTPTTYPTPYSACETVTFTVDATITGTEITPDHAFWEPGPWITVFTSTDGPVYTGPRIDIAPGETRNMTFTVSPNLIDYDYIAVASPAFVSTRPLSIVIWQKFLGTISGARYKDPIVSYVFDPTEFAAPCFGDMAVATPFDPAPNGPPSPDRIALNNDAHIALYVRDDGTMDIYGVNEDSEGYLAIRLTAEEIDALPFAPPENTVLATFGDITLYHLNTGQFQINVGPDAEGKVQVFIYDRATGTVTRADFTVNGNG